MGDDPIERERLMIQVLCQAADGQVRVKAGNVLRSYRWRDPFCQTVFEIIAETPSGGLAAIRGELPARLTRKGFPDFDLDELFHPHGLSHEEVSKLVEQLKSWCSEKEGT
jgi:hypothetical protein